MKRWALTCAAAALALGAGAQRAEVPEAWRAGWETITVEDASNMVHHLAGPEFRGRSAFTTDFDRAAQWCALWMQVNGVEPGGPHGSYFQRFTMEYRSPDYGTLKVSVGGEPIVLANEGDFRFQANGDVAQTVPLAFVRLSKDAPMTGLDWAKFKGRLVLVHPDSPAESVTEALDSHRRTPTGAIDVIRIGTGPTAAGNAMRGHAELAPQTATPTGFRISLDAARALARAANADKFAAQHMAEPSVEFGEMLVQAKVKREKWYSTMNVVGKIPGSDPVLSRQAVVVGAHLDHMGEMRGEIYWGADDNASGSSAAMMIGRALAKNKVRPKRTVIIGLWSSEERGLFGSQMYAAQPTIPMEDTVAYLNMDMVGRDAEFAQFNDRPEDNRNAIYIASAEFSSPELYRFLKGTNRYVGLNLRDDKNDRTRRSDTGSFYDKNVPVLKAFTGEHKDYHKPTDTPDKLNYPKMANVARWLYISTCELANTSWRPSFDTNGRMVVGQAKMEGNHEFSDDAVFYATLVECNVDGSSPMVIDRTSQVAPGPMPFVFALKYHHTRIDPHKLYVVRASVFENGKEVARTKAGLRVLTYNHPSSNVVVMMEPKVDALERTEAKQQR